MSNAEEIQSEIERTRGEMADTLLAIERKFSPNRLMDEAMETMNSTLTQTRIRDLVRENPLPLALVGVGIGWLVLSSLRSSSPVTTERLEDYGEAGYPASMAAATDDAEDWAAAMGEKVTEGAKDLADSAQSRARKVAHRVDRATRDIRRQASDVFQDHPLTIGLFAVVAGLAVGAALPRSRQEAEILGETSSDILRQARQTGREALHKAGKAVKRAAEVVTEGSASATTH